MKKYLGNFSNAEHKSNAHQCGTVNKSFRLRWIPFPQNQSVGSIRRSQEQIKTNVIPWSCGFRVTTLPSTLQAQGFRGIFSLSTEVIQSHPFLIFILLSIPMEGKKKILPRTKIHKYCPGDKTPGAKVKCFFCGVELYRRNCWTEAWQIKHKWGVVSVVDEVHC